MEMLIASSFACLFEYLKTLLKSIKINASKYRYPDCIATRTTQCMLQQLTGNKIFTVPWFTDVDTDFYELL